MAAKQFPLISVIVSAHNEEDYIEKTLKSIRNSNFSNYELIVVCDSCADSTFDLSKKYTKKVYKVNFKNISKVRNFGAKRSKGDVLVFHDADTVSSNNYLDSITGAIKHGYDYGCVKLVSDSKTLFSKYIAFVMNQFNRVHKTVGGSCFVKKEFFKKINGFDINLRKGEDTDFGERLYKIGAKYAFINNSYLIHCERRFRDQGYLRLYLKLLKEGALYTFSHKRYKEKFKC